MTEQNEPRGPVRFARDVGVNVTSNLIVAAIIYLVGATAGLFPRDLEVILVAVGSVMIGITLVTLLPMIRWARRGVSRKYHIAAVVASAALLAGGIVIVVLAIVGGYQLDPEQDAPRWLIVVVFGQPAVWSAMLLLVAVSNLRHGGDESEKQDPHAPTAPSQREPVEQVEPDPGGRP